ncbi:MAG: polysaccharide deacetylase family protein [Acidobacteria bacterium]|nr:polysaccharide deacetylase family protein [Acidobacteriota bacterium]NIQ83841.1 polysaccharide deacetylase family protein [Acidobacteriota bacterium]
MASEGVEFGGHTVTHPVLSQVDDERLASEIEGSFEALKRATGAEVRCFAYPNGRERDFDDRAVDLLRRRGVAAVTAEYGIVSRATLERDDALYRLPRVSLSEDPVRRMALIAGVEAARIDVGGG